MSPWFAALLTCAALAPSLAPSLALGQDAPPPYQDPSLRQVCEAGPVHDKPGGRVIGEAAAGEMIVVADMDFDMEGNPYLLYGEEEGPHAIRLHRTAHFCGFADRPADQPAAFLAPPNTCHVIAASRQTLDEVNAFAAAHADYLPSMNVFRARNGWYAISLGLVSGQAAMQVLNMGENVPDDAYCSDGANYLDAMDRQGDRFVEPDPPAPADPAQRRAEAKRLTDQGVDKDNLTDLRRACLMGNANGCGLYAERLTAQGDTSEILRREAIRYYLLGCMLGNAVTCHNALSDKNFSADIALFTALPDRFHNEPGQPMLETELRKIGCDADIAESCSMLARPLIQYGDRDLGRYLMALVATHRACELKGGYYCREFGQLQAEKQSILGTAPSPAANYHLAGVMAEACQMKDRPDSADCSSAYDRYAGFLESDAGSEDQRATATLFLKGGCKAGSAEACAYQSHLSEFLPLLDRRLAAARAKALCDRQDDPKGVCDRLDHALPPDLPEVEEPVRAKYAEYAEKCRTQQGTDGSNPCRDALWYYGGHISAEDIDEPLALLHETCTETGKITGCEPLANLYDGQEMLFANDLRKAWPAQPDKAFAAWKTGCIATLEAVGNCGSLGLYHERAGDFAAAAQAHAVGCETGMTATEGQYFGQGRICYWAAKNARDNLQDYTNARKWFDYTCRVDEDPFACKFLGLMQAQAEGGTADPLAALGLYHQGCDMIDDIGMGDGQSCFLYGQALLAQRDQVISDGTQYGYRIAAADDAAPVDLTRENLTAASRAFLRGCMDDRAEACAAHAELLRDWSAGAYPRQPHECRVMDASGQMAPTKTCQQFSFHLPPPEGLGDEAAIRIFVWPDGDRTVIFDDHATPSLNGAEGQWILPEGGWDCIQSNATGRSFCYG